MQSAAREPLVCDLKCARIRRQALDAQVWVEFRLVQASVLGILSAHFGGRGSHVGHQRFTVGLVETGKRVGNKLVTVKRLHDSVFIGRNEAEQEVEREAVNVVILLQQV